MDFIYESVTYKNITSNYWKLPEESWKDKFGNCADMCILFMYLVPEAV